MVTWRPLLSWGTGAAMCLHSCGQLLCWSTLASGSLTLFPGEWAAFDPPSSDPPHPHTASDVGFQILAFRMAHLMEPDALHSWMCHPDQAQRSPALGHHSGSEATTLEQSHHQKLWGNCVCRVLCITPVTVVTACFMSPALCATVTEMWLGCKAPAFSNCTLERLSYMKSVYVSKPLSLTPVLIKEKILSLSSQC